MPNGKIRCPWKGAFTSHAAALEPYALENEYCWGGREKHVEYTQWPPSMFQRTRDGNEGIPDDLKLLQ